MALACYIEAVTRVSLTAFLLWMLKITCLPPNEELYVRGLPFILHNAEHINPHQEEKAADCSRAISTPSESTRSMSIFLLPLIPKIICHLQSKGFLKVNLQPTASLSSSLPPPPPNPPDTTRLRSIPY